MRLNKTDKKRLAKMQEFCPEGLKWAEAQIWAWWTSHCHDLKAIPEKLVAVNMGDKATEYLQTTFVDDNKKKSPKPTVVPNETDPKAAKAAAKAEKAAAKKAAAKAAKAAS